jgi:hypothetical protein
MTTIVEVPKKVVNSDALTAELKASAGASFEGWSMGKTWPGVLRLHFVDGTPQAVIDAALTVYAAHNPAVLTPAQQLAARRETAKGDLQAADFVAVLNQINAASTLADAKPILKKLLALTYRLALAQGMTDATDPGA